MVMVEEKEKKTINSSLCLSSGPAVAARRWEAVNNSQLHLRARAMPRRNWWAAPVWHANVQINAGQARASQTDLLRVSPSSKHALKCSDKT